MKRLYQEIVKILSQREKAVLATVIQQSGSAPRKGGAQMLIREDGSFLGSVGGGRLEADVLREARTVMTEGKTKFLDFPLTGTEVAEAGMICGGDVELFLEPLPPALMDIFTQILEVQKKGEEAVLATIISEEPNKEGLTRKSLLSSQGNTIGPIALDPKARQSAQKVIKEKRPQLIPYEGKRLYLEPIFAEPTLYIFGAGHISRSIAPVASLVGFQVVVIDDRAEFASREHFPLADEIWVEEFEAVGRRIEPDEQAYMVIVTRGHTHDYTVLKQVLPMKSRYIGMIGSSRKRNTIYKKLLQEGHTQKELDRVYAPIGLAIGAETPEEIAVSIVAELIQVRGVGKPPPEKEWKV
ncbi:MAG: XdhC family protein [Deltaproteobacteria bacterium]|nr:XdhC family protein [Deltaproteobacteria bacterium]